MNTTIQHVSETILEQQNQDNAEEFSFFTSAENNSIGGHTLRELVESHVYVENGQHFIDIPNCTLDHDGKFQYLGFTKAGNPKFGQIVSHGPDGIKTQKRIAKFDGKYLSLMNDQYLMSVQELQEGFFA